MIDLPGIRSATTPGSMLHRRQLLQAGVYTALAAALNQSRSLRASSIGVASPIRSCIFLMHYGGPSHLDTWDMKPEASSEVRGEYRPIATSVPGRMVCEHWPNCFHVLFAGGGVKAGSTYGESDNTGAYPQCDPVTPFDLAATIFWRFGIDHRQEIHDGLGRPFRLSDGTPIDAMFGAG